MATSLVSNLRLSKETDCVREWLEIFENAASVFIFAHADKLPDDANEKTAKTAELMRTLLTVNLGPDALKKLRAFTFPAEIKDTDYATLRKTLVDRLSPKTNIVAQQQKFMTLNQIAGESLCTFMSRLKEAANVCQFGDLFDLMVRTRFVAGLSSDRIRAELISESATNDTSASLFDKAQTKENALQSSINCRKPGHIAKNCRSAKKQSHCVEGIGDHDDGNACAADYGYTHQESENTLYCVETADPVQIPVQTPVPDGTLPASVKLRVANFNCESIHCKALVNVEFRGKKWILPLYVVDCRFPTLLGREWIIQMFGKDWLDHMIGLVDVEQSYAVSKFQRDEFVSEILRSPVFDPGVGTVKGFEACLQFKPDARAKFCKARQVPFAIVDKVGKAIDELVKNGQLIPTEHSDWASPIVPVMKADGTIRICGDYKTTVNPNLDTAIYPLPTIEDCLSKIVGGKLFTKLDIRAAYNSLKLRECDQKIVTLNTHKGLFSPTSLPFGISSAGPIFERKIDDTLRKTENTAWRVDDILITGPDDESHMKNVRTVITALEKEGYKCRLDKCVFMEPKVTFLGHEVSADGIRPLSSKVETIVRAPYPTTRAEMISFLGGAQYYSRFIPNMSTVVEPLNRLRPADSIFHFGDREKRAFDELKALLSSDLVLTVYNPELELKLDTDASSVGLGAVMSHIDENGTERPIEYISRTLTKSERNYSMIEKEALAIVWATKRLHRYLFGRPFTLVTDHKPLESIFHPSRGIPSMVAGRLQRWSLFLSGYTYKIQFRPTGKHCNADLCSRFPLPLDTSAETREFDDELTEEFEMKPLDTVFSVHYFGDDKPLIDAELIASHTRRDKTLGRVLQFVKDGWNEKPPVDVELKPFYTRRNELSVDQNCIVWGSRVVIPESMRKSVLSMLHATHMGISQTKALARGYVYWPNMDAEIEKMVKLCEPCQLNQKKPARSTPHPWAKTMEAWERIHLDFCGPFLGSMWLIVICSYSKWLEVVRMTNITSKRVIQELRDIFSRWGLPKILVSDNGSSLTSEEFKVFTNNNQIRHVLIPAYSPASNGQAEVAVGLFKRAMKRMILKNPDVMCNLADWLLNYRNTPHTTTGVEPAVAMMKRRTRNALSFLHPSSSSKFAKVALNDQNTIAESRLRDLKIDDTISFYDENKKCWRNGVIEGKEGTKVLLIKTPDGVYRKHLDQVIKRSVVSEPLQQTDPDTPRVELEIRDEQSSTAIEGDFKKTASLPESTEPETSIIVGNNPNLPAEPDHKAAVEPIINAQPVLKPRELAIEIKRSTMKPNIVREHELQQPNLLLPANFARDSKPPDRLSYRKLGGT
ncbi:uncharacterized protein K02A2.6-like [Bolinopsis microptera]|uniref:uncharacterized protein K02A2.6-like n=1 Tax=Bolinopsis microptera TaxID=2820187 RepID=UPI003078AFB0